MKYLNQYICQGGTWFLIKCIGALHWQKQAWLCRSKYKFLSIKKDKLSVPLQVYDSKLVPTTLGEKHVKTDSSLKSVCRPELYHLRTYCWCSTWFNVCKYILHLNSFKGKKKSFHGGEYTKNGDGLLLKKNKRGYGSYCFGSRSAWIRIQYI